MPNVWLPVQTYKHIHEAHVKLAAQKLLKDTYRTSQNCKVLFCLCVCLFVSVWGDSVQISLFMIIVILYWHLINTLTEKFGPP